MQRTRKSMHNRFTAVNDYVHSIFIHHKTLDLLLARKIKNCVQYMLCSEQNKRSYTEFLILPSQLTSFALGLGDWLSTPAKIDFDGASNNLDLLRHRNIRYKWIYEYNVVRSQVKCDSA